MPGPFFGFLESQNSHATLLYGLFRDFYIARGDRLHVVDNPPAAERVAIVDPSGATLASAAVVSGRACLEIGIYHFPLAARVTVYDRNSSAIACTSTVELVGGDVYAVERYSALA